MTTPPCGHAIPRAGCEDCLRPPPPRPPRNPPPPADPEPGPGPYRWVSTADLARDAVRLAAMLPADVSAVVGVPRSGMIPAGVVAACLHLPLYQITRDGCLQRLGHGSRGETFGFAPGGGPVAVVDDTLFRGREVARCRAALAGLPVVHAAVYATPEHRARTDVVACDLPDPHLLEWNIANTYVSASIGWDVDGVIVHEPGSGGPPGSPYLVPRARPARLIATGRRERHRAATEAQLRRLGVRWDRLEMLPDDAPGDAAGCAAHKARHYADSRCTFFVESCPTQAELIAGLSGRPVICPAAGRVFGGDDA